MVRIKAQFEPEMLARLNALAESNGISLAALIRAIITEWFAMKGVKS